MSNAPAPAGAEVRAMAARCVAKVLADRVAADELLVELSPAERDRALLGALVFGALRWHQRLEWQVSRLLTRPLQKDQAELAALLRVGLLQLQELRVPAHAAVSATVDAAALIGARSARGLVNAVLRRYQRERAALERAALEVPEARFSHPTWLIESLRRDWPEGWQQMLEENNLAAPMWLRVNQLRTTREAYLARLSAEGIGAQGASDVQTAVLLDAPCPVESLPGFATGLVSVQDIAAQRAADWLKLAPGLRVLDACAAPGGKTGHILEACSDLEEVWALDRDPKRLTKVKDNLERLALPARLVLGDAARPSDWWDGRSFDRILLDAPCSATGVIRRHPDIKVLRTAADVERAATRQAKLLEALWPLLSPGGLLLYATCSVLKRENEDQIAHFIAAEPSAGTKVALRDARQFAPGEAQGDGFYYASLVKA